MDVVKILDNNEYINEDKEKEQEQHYKKIIDDVLAPTQIIV